MGWRRPKLLSSAQWPTRPVGCISCSVLLRPFGNKIGFTPMILNHTVSTFEVGIGLAAILMGIFGEKFYALVPDSDRESKLGTYQSG